MISLLKTQHYNNVRLHISREDATTILYNITSVHARNTIGLEAVAVIKTRRLFAITYNVLLIDNCAHTGV